MLLTFFFLGSAAFPLDAPSRERSSRATMRAACTCGLGAAICGLVLFAVGSFGWLTIPGVVVGTLLAFCVLCAVRRISPLRTGFWSVRLRALAGCWSWPVAVVYVAAIVIATRAVIPEGTGYSDSIFYHLAYAQDWANAGKLVVDPYMSFIFYANNFVLFYAAWIVLHASGFVQFATWAFGLLAAVALYAAIEDVAPSPRARAWSVPIGLFSVAALIFSPIFIDYSVLGYIDVPIGAMALLSVVAIQLGIGESSAKWLVASAVLAGFLVGMKASFLVLLPVFAVALFWACRSVGAGRKTAAVVLAALCAVAAPWYVRNLILAGDPIAPALNIALYGHDGLWKAIEWNGLWNDMATSKSPRAFLTLPVRAYLHPKSQDFREYGASALVLFAYVPALVALFALLLRRRLSDALAIPIFVLTAFVLYWFVSTSLLRYALLFYPLLALCAGSLLVMMAERLPRAAPAAAALAVAIALPPFSSLAPDGDFIQNDLLSDARAFLHYRGEQAFLVENDDGYADEELASAWMREHGYSGNVFVISDNAFDYYFRRNHVTSIGNWTGPAGWFRLLQAIDAGEAPEFLDDLGTRAVFFSPQQLLDAGIERILAEQLRQAGYRQVPLTHDSSYRLYVRG